VVAFGVWTGTVARLDVGVPQMFPDGHNLNDVDAWHVALKARKFVGKSCKNDGFARFFCTTNLKISCWIVPFSDVYVGLVSPYGY
jgi:hypothetical protein